MLNNIQYVPNHHDWSVPTSRATCKPSMHWMVLVQTSMTSMSVWWTSGSEGERMLKPPITIESLICTSARETSANGSTEVWKHGHRSSRLIRHARWLIRSTITTNETRFPRLVTLSHLQTAHYTCMSILCTLNMN